MSELLKVLISYFTNFFTEESKKNEVSFLIIINLISIFTFVIKFVFRIKSNINPPQNIEDFINYLFNLYVYGVINLIIFLMYFFILFCLVKICLKYFNHGYSLYLYYDYDDYKYFQSNILINNIYKLIKIFYFKTYPFVLIAYTLINDISYKKINYNNVFFYSLLFILIANSIYILNDLSYEKKHGRNYESSEFSDNFTVISESEVKETINGYFETYFLCFSNNNKLKLYYIFKKEQNEDYYVLVRNFYEYDEIKKIFSDLNENILKNNKMVKELNKHQQAPPFNPEDE